MADPARPVDALPRADGGPPLSEELRAEIRRVLGNVGRFVTLCALPEVLDHDVAAAAVRSAWGAVRDAPGPPGVAQAVVFELHELAERLTRLSVDRAEEVSAALARVIGRLEAADSSIPHLVRLVPELICELGFNRAVISRVEDNVWIPELLFVVGDPEFSAELTRVGRASPQPLVPGRYETELVSTQRAILVRNVDVEPWRAHPGIASLTRTRSYVAAPIVSDGQVVGILHGERFGQDREVDEADRTTLMAFAQAVRLALSRATLAGELQAVHQRMVVATRSVDRVVGALHQIPPMRLLADAGYGAEDLAPASGPADGKGAQALPASLSGRELEVLALIAEGKTNATIARRLGIAESTVKQHVKNILRKLTVNTRSEAVARWFQLRGEAGPQ